MVRAWLGLSRAGLGWGQGRAGSGRARGGAGWGRGAGRGGIGRGHSRVWSLSPRPQSRPHLLLAVPLQPPQAQEVLPLRGRGLRRVPLGLRHGHAAGQGPGPLSGRRVRFWTRAGAGPGREQLALHNAGLSSRRPGQRSSQAAGRGRGRGRGTALPGRVSPSGLRLFPGARSFSRPRG